jgi:hypothetical protein
MLGFHDALTMSAWHAPQEPETGQRQSEKVPGSPCVLEFNRPRHGWFLSNSALSRSSPDSLRTKDCNA